MVQKQSNPTTVESPPPPVRRSPYEEVANAANLRMTFIAKRRVDSEAFDIDRAICHPGDKIEVLRWICFMGPTIIKVYKQAWCGYGRESCIPFEWVMEMGAPADLAKYMPFAPKTWQEILDEANQGVKP